MTISKYKFNDFTPLVFKTTDFGKTWTRIVEGIAAEAWARVVREDPVRKDLLYLGTETGFYISFNGGQRWTPFQLNLPLTPITDLKVHNNDLVASTAGRAFWILDDLSPLQQWTDATAGDGRASLQAATGVSHPGVRRRIRRRQSASPAGARRTARSSTSGWRRCPRAMS